jgi:hypothetical protein
VVKGVTREGKVTGSYPAGRVVRKFYTKNAVTCDFDGDGRVLAGGGLPGNFFSIFFGDFFVLNFAECRALGKGFAECPIKKTRQSSLCRHFFFFAVWALPSAL